MESLHFRSTKSTLPPPQSADSRAGRPPVLRRSNTLGSINSAAATRRSSSAGDDLYVRKLRNAVFTALQERDVTEGHKQFRACFKKLFEVCKVFTEDEFRGSQAAKGITEKLTQVGEKFGLFPSPFLTLDFF